MEFRKLRKRKAKIDIIPIIDIVFTLNLFLLISSSFEKTAGLQIDLPQSKSNIETTQETTTIKISVPESGQLFLTNDRNQTIPMTHEALHQHLQKFSKHRPQPLVIIYADKDVSHGTVVKILDLVKSSNLSRVAISTEPTGKIYTGAPIP